MHDPPLQIWSERHWLPQLPQWLGSFCRSMQRPPPQVDVPGPHAHCPATQACVSAHWCPQEPQLDVLVAVSTSQPLLATLSQSAKLALHWYPQVDALQVRDALARVGQTWLQDPQWSGSVVVSTHCPPQFVCPLGQLVMHCPPEHTWFVPQALPHWPQLLLLVLVSTHCPPHFDSPALHWMPHWPLVQVAEPLAGTGQTWPQAPQFDGSLAVGMQEPPQRE